LKYRAKTGVKKSCKICKIKNNAKNSSFNPIFRVDFRTKSNKELLELIPLIISFNSRKKMMKQFRLYSWDEQVNEL